MKTIILGYSDEAGQTTPTVVCLPSVSPAEQIATFNRAQRDHVFPKGIRRLAFCVLDERDTAIFMGEDVAGARASVREAFEKAHAEKNAKAAAEAKSKSALGAAEKAVKEAAQNRNRLLSELHVAKTKLRNAELANAQMPDPLHAAAVEAAKKVLFGDPEKKVAALEDRVKDAVAIYDKAAAKLSALQPKTAAKEEPKSQLAPA